MVSLPPYRPQLATLAREPPSSDEWLCELKHDGWRMSCGIDSGRVRLVSRHARIWTDTFPVVQQAAQRLPLKSALLDGELAVVLQTGLTSFQALNNRGSLPPGAKLVYFAFDLIYLNGEDVGRRPLESRKAILESLLEPEVTAGVLRYTPHIIGEGPRVLAHACALGAEGIVSKRRRSIYVPGRSRDWLKCKCARIEPFVIGGYTEASGAGGTLGTLLVGQHDALGRLCYAGSVGTGMGFNREFLRELHAQLLQLVAPSSPFEAFNPTTVRSPWGKRQPASTRWVRPLVVIDVAFLERSSTGQLRHPSFRRFRPDLVAASVIRLQ